ncbi:MAG: hypothetical protein N3G19_02155 [Candidatus Pacearchaeota archaeon]|nr:hypothetical protein [Candidatus Pacearchaeota archaeon]
MHELYENLIGEDGNLIPDLTKPAGNLQYFLRNDIKDFRNALGDLPEFENLENLIQVIPPTGFTASIENFIKKLWYRYCSLRTDPNYGEKIVAKKFEIAKKIGKLRKVRGTHQDVDEDAEFEVVFAPCEVELLKDIKNKVVKLEEIIESRNKTVDISVQRLEEILNKTTEPRLINLAMATYIREITNVIRELEEDSLAKSVNINYFKYHIVLPELVSLFEVLKKKLVESIATKMKSEAFIRPSPMLLVNQKIIPQQQYSIGTIEASLLYNLDYFPLGIYGYKFIGNFLKSALFSLIKDRKFEDFLIDKTDRKFVEKLKQNVLSAMEMAIKNPDIVNEMLRREEVDIKLKDLLKKEKLDSNAINVYLNFLTDWRRAEALFPAINRIKNVEYLLRNEEKKIKLKEEHENGNIYRFDEQQIIYRNKKTISINFDMRDSTIYADRLGNEFNALFDDIFNDPLLDELCKKYKATSKKRKYAGDEQLYSFIGMFYPAVNSLLFIKEFLQEFKEIRERKKEILKSKYGEDFGLEFGAALYLHFFNPEKPEDYESGITIVRDLSKSIKEINDSQEELPSVCITEKGIYNYGLIIAENCNPESRETFIKSLEDELSILNRADIIELKEEPFYKILSMAKETKGDIRLKSSKDIEKEGTDLFTNKLCLHYYLFNSFSKNKGGEGKYNIKYKEMDVSISETDIKAIITRYCSGIVTYSIPLIASEHPDLIKIAENYPLRTSKIALYVMPLDKRDFEKFVSFFYNDTIKWIYNKWKKIVKKEK